MPSEESVMAVIDHIEIAAGSVKNGLQAGKTHSVHGIEHNARMPAADGRNIDLFHDGIKVTVSWIDKYDQPAVVCLLE